MFLLETIFFGFESSFHFPLFFLILRVAQSLISFVIAILSANLLLGDSHPSNGLKRDIKKSYIK